MPKWITPVLVTLAIAAIGSISAVAVANFKATEAYDAVRTLEKDASSNTTEHKAIAESLRRIETQLQVLQQSLQGKADKK